jgi:glycerol kinase
MGELVLAIDAGTTNLRVCLFHPDGRLLGQSALPVETRSPAPGLVEQDAEAIWRSLQTAIGRTLARAGRTAQDLACIGVTSQRTSAVVWDRMTGVPLTPLVVWSDLRGVTRARALNREAGTALAPQQAAAKLEAMVASCTDVPGTRLAFGNIDTFLIWKLSGGAAHLMDRSQAWPTGYLDLNTLGWNSDLLAFQGLSADILPQLCDTWGPLAVSDARAIGAAVPITADVADQQAALIGQGCESAGEFKVTYGTSATLDMSTGGAFLYPDPNFPPFILSATGGDFRFCLEGMVFTAGAALDWLRASFGLGDHAAFAALADSVASSEGVAFLPALQGLGAPWGDPTRRAALVGLGGATTRGHIALAALESLAFRVCEIHLRLRDLTDLPSTEQLRADGGLTGSDRLMQLQADLIGLPVARHAHREATAAGAAVCAARGAGLLAPGETRGFVGHDRVFEPSISRDEAATRLAAWQAAVHPAS